MLQAELLLGILPSPTVAWFSVSSGNSAGCCFFQQWVFSKGLDHGWDVCACVCASHLSRIAAPQTAAIIVAWYAFC